MAAAVASLEPLGTPNNKPFMQAFDQSGGLLGTVYFQGALPTNPLEVTPFERLTFSIPPCVGGPRACAGYGIGKVRFSSQQSQPGPIIWALFDDFQWNPPVCSAPVIPNGNGSACAGTINTDTCTNWTCDAGFTPQGSNPVCSDGTWTGTYSCTSAIGSAYYDADGDVSKMFIVSPAAVATEVTTYSLAYPLAVRRTVLLGQRDDVGAREFTLAGLPTGLSFIGNGAFSQLLDGTTDGVQWNYAIECCGSANSIVRTNTVWRNSTALFDAPGDGRGIAYDTRRNHLFVSILNDALIREYDLAGTLLNTFAVAGGPGPLVGLAYEQLTDTLWGKTNGGSTLYQFNKSGALLKTVPVTGLTPANDYGGEMRIRPMIDFQSLEHVDASISSPVTSYAEDGFVITGTLLSTFGTLEGRYTGSTALFEDLPAGVVELRSSDGSPFDLISIDLAELNGPAVATVTFTGDLLGGGTVTQVFTLDGLAFGTQIFKFGPEFTGLTAVRWSQVSPYHQFDNIVAEATELDSDGDGFTDSIDNCPTVANPGQEDGAAGLEIDPVTLAFSPDAVGDACDNCTRVNNPRVYPGLAATQAAYLAANPWATLSGGQRDDDHDGYGNMCDADFTAAGVTVGPDDLTQYRAASGKARSSLTACGVAGTATPPPQRCSKFDLNELGVTIGPDDLTQYRRMSGKTKGPRCATNCTGLTTGLLPCASGTATTCTTP